MLKRTLDAAHLNAVANHPAVRPWIGGEGPLDLTAVIADPRNIALEGEPGGWVFARHEPGTYEVHTLWRPEGRGSGQLRAFREALRYLFTATDAREIVTRIPVDNEGAMYGASLSGFRQRFRRERAFRQSRGEGGAGEPVDVSYQALTIDDWAARDAEALNAGEVFHAQLQAAKARGDGAWPEHPEDLAHDRAAGAACLIIAAGNLGKGIWFYNRWAALAGYPPIRLVAEAPPLIDVGMGVIVTVNRGEMEVVKCP
jgi:hypothetical protein